MEMNVKTSIFVIIRKLEVKKMGWVA